MAAEEGGAVAPGGGWGVGGGDEGWVSKGGEGVSVEGGGECGGGEVTVCSRGFGPLLLFRGRWFG